MMQYALVDEFGIATQLGANTTLPEGAMEVPYVQDLTSYLALMLVAGEWLPRPQLSDPLVVQTEDGSYQITFNAVPEGTVCVVADLTYGLAYDPISAVEGQLSFEIASWGEYQFEVTPPKPWLAMTLNAELQ